MSEQLKVKSCNLEPLFLSHKAWLVHRLQAAMKVIYVDCTWYLGNTIFLVYVKLPGRYFVD